MQQLHHGLTCLFQSGDALRSRCVSDTVLSSVLDIPQPPAKATADWAREIAVHLQLQAGDVTPLPLARTRARWPACREAVQSALQWTQQLGLGDVLAQADMALMACRGARYHHDAAQYGHSAFCNLFLTPDQGLDLHFPGTGQRIPLTQGTAVIFDTGQPHAVVRRGSGFDAHDFDQDPSCTQVFLTWELPIEHPRVAHALQVAFDLKPGGTEQGSLANGLALLRNNEPVCVCPDSGQWRPAPG